MRHGTRLIFLNCPLRPADRYPSFSHTIRRIESLMRIAARFGLSCHTVEFAGHGHHAAPAPAERRVRRTDCLDATRMQGWTGAGDPAQHAVLCGYEAHVSVLQTALGLLRRTHKVTIVADAVDAASAQDKALALERMAHEGAVLATTEMLAFEWAGSFDAATCRAILEELDPRPGPACPSATPCVRGPLSPTPPLIGDRIRHMRREKGLKLTDLGRLAACSLPHLSKIETNKGSPSLSVLMRISAALGTDVDHFLDHKRNGAAPRRPAP